MFLELSSEEESEVYFDIKVKEITVNPFSLTNYS